MRPGVCLAQRDVGAPGDRCWRHITAKAVFLPLGPIWSWLPAGTSLARKRTSNSDFDFCDPPLSEAAMAALPAANLGQGSVGLDARTDRHLLGRAATSWAVITSAVSISGMLVLTAQVLCRPGRGQWHRGRGSAGQTWGQVWLHRGCSATRVLSR